MIRDGVVVQAMMLDPDSDGGAEWLAANRDDFDCMTPDETADVGDRYDCPDPS